ncbi:MAG: bifunctional diaminohydroxyphosphoribosylaminopyrimidine deaminase/5-amino-6-(5-phosphoribosylamino)uracil reductase RibD [Candidatus Eisenbacteria bacterium]|nr:bifunctional diaminohydroxyphosphoribosylaminopyrimidine deaminase/5-amino-6-(5-phosphoribosylamino)uracil reductase RibD [Candidatus Eisenbacteria bacterium]
MARALELAGKGCGRTSPNPAVGAVVVRGGRIVGEGWHRCAGADHAEVVALRQAGEKARGATMVVTLEPCAHHGRTPPCVDALVRAGIARCVVAVRDPHAIVNGRGLRRLRQAGIAVEVGLMSEAARELLGGYWLAHTAGRPRVTWKLAVTLDGKVADRRRRSKWITGPDARRMVHALRAASDAIVIGAGTARADDPRLTARADARGRRPGVRRQPLRVVCDTRLRLPPALRLFGPSLASGTVVACGAEALATRATALERRGVTVWRLPLKGGHVSPAALAGRLAREGRYEVLLESGPTLGTAWLRAGLVDRIALFTAPAVLGAEGLPWLGPLGRGSLARALPGRIAAQAGVGRDAFVMVELSREGR